MPTRHAAASSTASAGAPRSTNAPTTAVARSRSRSLFFWALALPAVTLALCVLVPACLRYATLQHGQSFAILTNTTIINYPENFDTRYRGPEYASYDRFFFQWWNFLVYDAETHDHWTIVYHAQRFSSTAKQPHYAMTSMVHKRGPVDQSVAVEAFPLERMTFTDGSWDVAMTRQDGTVPHRVTVIDADTYNVVASYLPEDVTIGQRVSWNLTFHRVHGVFSSRDSEARNVEHCSVASTLFGYHSRVTGWIQEGDVRREFGADEAASTRYRAYAAGSWGCKLPAGYPTIEYPWTWAWLVIPGEKDSVSGAVTRPDIGLVLGTARFQSNVSLVGDLFGGYAVLGVGADLHTHTFADVHHGRTFEVPLVRASTDEYLRVLELEYGNWTDIVDPSGTYRVPLRQTYVIESAHYRARLDFHSRAEQYFRLPIVLEHRSTEEAANDPEKPLAVFSDFRACGVRTHVQIWHREHTLAEQAAVQSQQRRQHQLTGVPPPSKTEEAAPSSSVDAASLAAAGPGGWTSVVHDGWVDSLNALEFAYQAPLADEEMYRVYTQPQFKKPRMHAQAQAQKKREAAEAVEAKAKKAQQ